MLTEAKFLERLIKDLLELSKLQSLEFKIEKSDVSINKIIDEVVRSAKKISKDTKIEIDVNKSVDDIKISGDYHRLRQMFMIILDNAIKFSNYGDRVSINISKNKLTINDEGIGIFKEDIPYIFERFYQSRYENNKTGTGLGLAIAKKIADRHDIKLKVESERNVGSSFIFNF